VYDLPIFSCLQIVDDLAATFNVGRADLNVVSDHHVDLAVRVGLTQHSVHHPKGSCVDRASRLGLKMTM